MKTPRYGPKGAYLAPEGVTFRPSSEVPVPGWTVQLWGLDIGELSATDSRETEYYAWFADGSFYTSASGWRPLVAGLVQRATEVAA